MPDFYQILQREKDKKQSDLFSDGKTEQTTEAKEDEIKEEKVSAPATEILVSKNEKIIKKSSPQKTKAVDKLKTKKSNSPSSRSAGLQRTKKKSPLKKSSRKKNDTFLAEEVDNPIWLTLSEAAKIGGVKKKTIKRAILASLLKYRIVENRYQVNLRSVLFYFFSHKKLWNKLCKTGIGQYIENWKE